MGDPTRALIIGATTTLTNLVAGEQRPELAEDLHRMQVLLTPARLRLHRRAVLRPADRRRCVDVSINPTLEQLRTGLSRVLTRRLMTYVSR
jgi:hypothetical protein